MATTHLALEQALQAATTPFARIDALNRLAYSYAMLDLEKLENLAHEAEQLALEISYEAGRLAAQVLKTKAQVLRGEFEGALAEAHRLLPRVEKDGDAKCLAVTLGILGRAFAGLSNYPLALGYYMQQIRLGEEIDDAEEIVVGYLGLGMIHAELKNYAEAIRVEEEALTITRLRGVQSQEDVCLNNLAVDYNEVGEHAKALQLAQEAEQLLSRFSDRYGMRYVWATIAQAHTGLGNFAEAERLLAENLALLTDADGIDVKFYTLLSLVKFHQKRGDPAKTLTTLKEALAVVQTQKNLAFEAQLRERMATVYEEMGELALALHERRELRQVEQTIFNEQADQRLKSLQIAYQTEAANKTAALLKDENAVLEGRVLERTQALEASLARERQLKQDLEAALAKEAEISQLKSLIITNVSHEFRTPLAIIGTSVEMLTKYSDKLTAEKRGEVERRVYSAMFYLRDLIQAIVMVDATKNEQVEARPIQHEVAILVQHLKLVLENEMEHPPNLRFEQDELTGSIQVDAELLRQVLFDLLSNALKYAPTDKPVVLKFTQENDALVMTVCDEGIGIPPAEIGHIFELFYRASNVETRRGLGLGLYIVDKLVSLMNGAVEVESAGIGQGSVFRVRLPLQNN